MSNKIKTRSSLLTITIFGIAALLFLFETNSKTGTTSYYVLLITSFVWFIGMMISIYLYLKDRDYFKRKK